MSVLIKGKKAILQCPNGEKLLATGATKTKCKKNRKAGTFAWKNNVLNGECVGCKALDFDDEDGFRKILNSLQYI